jgi:hypothetical protein
MERSTISSRSTLQSAALYVVSLCIAGIRHHAVTAIVIAGLGVAFLFDRFVLKRPQTALGWPVYVPLFAFVAVVLWVLPG